MPKLKTHRGAAKRLKRTGTGKIRRTPAGRRHLLTHKSRDRKRRLRKSEIISSANVRHASKLLPYS